MRLLNKKGIEMPINVIIVAAIALIVLVVVIFIFTGRLGIFGQKVGEVGQECAAYKVTKDGSTQTAQWLTTTTCGTGYKEIFTATDASAHPGEHCCIIA